MNTALVIGASGTIGRGITQALIQEGYAVACHCYSSKGRDALQKLLTPLSSSYTILQGDCTEEWDVVRIFAETRQRLTNPSVVVNCMGSSLPQQLLEEQRVEQMDKLLRDNVLSSLLISREASKYLRQGESGLLVHIGSMWGSIGASCEVIYSATKGAIHAMTKALAKELAPSRVRVNAIAPGLVLSPMNSHLSQGDLESFREETPLACYVTPEDIAQGVLYLLHTPSITGQILAVDGGMVI